MFPRAPFYDIQALKHELVYSWSLLAIASRALLKISQTD